MSLPAEVRAKYIEIIDDILSKTDLTQITEKRIRNGIQERVEYDITPQKPVIKELILERFDVFFAKQNPDNAPIPSVEKAESVAVTNGHTKSESRSSSNTAQKREADESEPSDFADAAPPKKKRRESVDDDAAYAARLQAELNQAARSTRGGASRKTAPVKKKKTPKKKTAARVTGSDDSDVGDGDEGKTRKVNRNTGFHKPMNLSSTAAEFFGTTQLSRPQVTKQVWAYIKEHKLQDESNKQFILPDQKLKTLLKQDKVQMFQMTKILNTHLYNPEE